MTWLVIETFVLMVIAVAVGVFLGAMLRQISGIDQPIPAGAGHGRAGSAAARPVVPPAPPSSAAAAAPPALEATPAPAVITPEPEPEPVAPVADPVATVAERVPPVAESESAAPVAEPVQSIADAPAPEPVAAFADPAPGPSDTIIDAAKAGAADQVGVRPPALAGARDGKPDDLKKIKGIGPQNEQRLNALGIFHFAQIAGWTPEEARWVGTYLAFPGRIEREDWIGQAQRHAG